MTAPRATATGYRRLRLGAHARAAVGEIEASSVALRAYLLASTLMGVWLTVRIDPLDAAALCETLADAVERSRFSEAVNLSG